MTDELGTSDSEDRLDERAAGASEAGEMGSEPADLSQQTSGGLGFRSGVTEHTSDALYIVREANMLIELEDALAENDVGLKEEGS